MYKIFNSQLFFIFTAVNKFGKNIYRPNRIRNSEMMDLLSRVPDDETLVCIHLILLY